MCMYFNLYCCLREFNEYVGTVELTKRNKEQCSSQNKNRVWVHFFKKYLKIFNTLQDYHVCSLSSIIYRSMNLFLSDMRWGLVLASTWFTFLYLQNFPWKHKYANIIYCFASKYFRYIKFIFQVKYKVDEYTHIYLEIGNNIGFFCKH